MNYSASITDFFKSPKWMMNMLLGGLCALIPIVGPIVTKGWLITGFWGRDDERFETFPDFDFNQFAKYLERGLWPFLVTLVSSFVLSMVLSFCTVPIMMLPGFFLSGHNNEAGGCAAAILVIMMVVFYLVMVVAIMFVLTPLTLKASMTQDFASAFDFTFAKRLVSLTWKEMAIGFSFPGLVQRGAGLRWHACFLHRHVFCHRSRLLRVDASSQAALPALPQPRRRAVPLSPKLRD